MGKLYCKIENKWCKYLKRGVCTYCNSHLSEVSRCPRLAEIETLRFAELLEQVDFNNVWNVFSKLYPELADGYKTYRVVFDKLRRMVPHKHNLNDIFISITKETESDGTVWHDVHGVNLGKPIRYSIEFEPWNNWISYFFTQETLDSLTANEIVAHCLWEMTFYGYDEQTVHNSLVDLENSIDEYEQQAQNQSK